MKLEQRVVIDKEELRRLVFKAKKLSKLTWKEFSKKLGICGSTLRESYLYDNRTIPYSVFLKLCKWCGYPPNLSFKLIKEIREANWSKKYAGSIGGKKRERKFKNRIKTPRKTQKLAELAGIIMGDGSVYPPNYTLQISFNREADIFYCEYVFSLIKNLFGIVPKKYDRPKEGVILLRVNSKELYNFLVQQKIIDKDGKKRIPAWIFKNDKFVSSFIRGLVDTDGSMFFSSKWCVLSFSSSRKALRELFKKILKDYNIPVCVSGNKVNLTSLWKIKKYLKFIGTSNLKNVIKFLEYLKTKRKILTSELKELSKKYRGISLPYFFKEGL